MTDEFDISSVLPSIEVYPFPLTYNLNADGMVLPSNSQILVVRRSAFLECPFCKAIGDIYKIAADRSFNVIYCKGNQPPEFEHQNPFNGSTHKHEIPCAPIHFSHFHIKCFVCEEIFYIHTPPEK